MDKEVFDIKKELEVLGDFTTISSVPQPVPYVYGKTVVELMKRDERIVCLCADVQWPTENDYIRKHFPERSNNSDQSKLLHTSLTFIVALNTLGQYCLGRNIIQGDNVHGMAQLYQKDGTGLTREPKDVSFEKFIDLMSS